MEKDRISHKTPNFLVIGAARSGTTSLHGLLIQHPEIYLPRNKQPEPHFFLKTSEYKKGYHYYLKKHFDNVANEKAIGEISTSYLFGDEVAERIWNYNSNMKLICMLRDPVQRAFSNYWHSKKNGFEKLEFPEAIHQAEQRHSKLDLKQKEIAPFAYIGRGLYGFQIEKYLKFFNRDQICILIMEEFYNDIQAEIKKLYNFLSVDSSFIPNTQQLNPNKSVPENEALSSELVAEISPYFRESNELLFNLIGRKPEAWN